MNYQEYIQFNELKTKLLSEVNFSEIIMSRSIRKVKVRWFNTQCSSQSLWCLFKIFFVLFQKNSSKYIYLDLWNLLIYLNYIHLNLSSTYKTHIEKEIQTYRFSLQSHHVFSRILNDDKPIKCNIKVLASLSTRKLARTPCVPHSCWTWCRFYGALASLPSMINHTHQSL